MSRKGRFWWAVVGVAALTVATGVSLANIYSADSSGRSPTADGAVEADPGMEHIHNLMIADNGLLMGTHEGLWMQRARHRAARIGRSHFDVMGLARIANGLIASGHPGQGEEPVNDLGLRGSVDQGMTWRNISLFGQVDFHRLVASGETILGIASHDRALLRSDDAGKTWYKLPNPDLFDIAINPTDPSIILGTSQSGLMRSTDGGRNFSAVGAVPLLALLSWDSSQLVGVTPAGMLYKSADNGSTWTKLATVSGEPAALAVRGNEVAVLAGMTVYYSTDGGLTFKARIVGVPGH